MKNILVYIIAASIITASAAAVYFAWQWGQVQKLTIQNDAIQGCAAAATAAAPGGFSGAVYNICVIDKGYDSSLK